jgi:formamidopyrimidine-DNA glycosylase
MKMSKVRITKRALKIRNREKMPELPEVETLRSQLGKVILNHTIRDIQIIDPKLSAINGAVGENVINVTRHGKALEIHLDNGKTLGIHLRMSGRFQWQDDQQGLPAHSRFTITFMHGRLVCIDPRRFATFSIYDAIPRLSLIEDPLRNFSVKRIKDAARNRKIPVKTFLMDQRVILGIGNIYACEILYEASVNPWREARSLLLKEWELIKNAANLILKRAIACRGTTVSDWRDLFGKSGEYQHELKVYASEGRECGKCHGIIRRERLGGRGTYFCPSCQK